MTMIALMLILLGLVIFVVGGIEFLIAAFQERIWWGLGCLFIPIVQIIFLIVHWQAARKPFSRQLVGFVVMVVGAILNPQPQNH
jgi:FtsH-binding integral membrane protein